jgi:hypothetical protein
MKRPPLILVALSAICIAFPLISGSQTNAAPIAAKVVGEVKNNEVDDDVRFANAQGADDDFVSYIVMEFDSAGLAGTSSIPSLRFSLTQANAGFTTDGGIEFFLTQDTTTDITPGVSALRATPDSKPTGIAPGDLAPLTSLGTANFVETATGDVDVFTFAIDDAVETYLLGQIASSGPLRFLVAASEEITTATYAGTGGGSPGTLPVPMLEVVPEPGSATLLILAASGLLMRRRRVA